MRAIPDELDSDVVATIDARLAAVAAEHRVLIPWAIESGSRAWGFPSPDSDYDCRFLYVRPSFDYLSLWTPRDVIETPLDKVYDVNGWDLTKALRLIVKGNATALEWLRSPIVYSGDEGFRDRILDFAGEVLQRDRVARHYLHVGRKQQAGKATLKRFFYSLRPAAALRWLADHPGEAVPPMDLPTLLAESSAGADVRDAATELIALKSATRELGDGTPPEVLIRFVHDELDDAERYEEETPNEDPAGARTRADDFFRTELARWSPR